MPSIKHRFALGACLVWLSSVSVAHARGPDMAPAINAGAPHLGERVDPSARFVNQDGQPILLGSLFDGRPVLLTFNYFRCRTLCDAQLMQLGMRVAATFPHRPRAVRLISISLDPRDTFPDAHDKRRSMMGNGRSSRLDWTFLVGQGDAVPRLARQLGVVYRYDPASEQYAHAPLTFALAPNGVAVRYLAGVDYEPRELRFMASEASAGRVSTQLDRVLLSCFAYDPATGRYSLDVLGAVRGAQLATTLALLVGFLLLRAREHYWRGPRP